MKGVVSRLFCGMLLAFAGAVALAAAAPCSSSLYELRSIGDAYVQASSSTQIASLFSVAPMTGAVSFSQLVQLAPSQPSSTAVLLDLIGDVYNDTTRTTKYPTGDWLQLSYDVLDSVLKLTILNNASNATFSHRSSSGSNSGVQMTTVQNDGSVSFTSGQYRTVTVVLDATNGGWVSIYVSGKRTAHANVPALAMYGLQFSASTASLTVGADLSGSNGVSGNLLDVAIFPNFAAENFVAKYLTEFRAPTTLGANGACTITPDAADVQLVLPTNSPVSSVLLYMKGSVGGAGLQGLQTFSRYSTFNYIPSFPSPFNLQPRVVQSNVPLFGQSWTPMQFAEGNCGMQQSASLPLPAGNAQFIVEWTIQWANATTAVSDMSWVNLTDATTNFTLRHIPLTSASGSKTILFLVNAAVGGTQQIVMTSNIASFCVLNVTLLQKGNVVAEPRVLFQGASASMELYTGVTGHEYAALTSPTTTCNQVDPASLIPVVPVINSDDGTTNYYTVTFQDVMVPRGIYFLCLYQYGMIDGNAMPAASCSKSDSSNTFLCSVDVAELPTNAINLTRSWITNFMHLGANYYDSIPYGIFEIDYFLPVGGQKYIFPQPGDYLGNLFWTPMERPDGLWGLHSPNATDTFEWIQYLSLALYAPVSHTISLSVRASSAVKIYLDQTNVFQVNFGLMNVSDALTAIYHSEDIALAAGWHQMTVKLWRAPNTTSSVFSLRVDQGVGILWDYYIPSNKSSSTNFTNVCVNVDQSNPCVPGAYNISHFDCVGMGCCYDPSSTSPYTCFASSQGALPYRTDARCGPGYPSAVSNVSICNVASSSKSYCCSGWGWCGNGASYCDCPTCVDANYAVNARCNYLPYGTGASCLGSRSIPFGTMTPTQCQALCDTMPGCSAVAMGLRTSVNAMGACNLLLSASCTATQEDRTVSQLFVRSCKSCGLKSQASTKCPTNTPLIRYPRTTADIPGISYNDCKQACLDASRCFGVQYQIATQACYFFTTPCPLPLQNNSAGYTVAMFSCASDSSFSPVPRPIPASAMNTTTFVHEGCYPDPTLTFLSAPSYPGFDNMNVYQANYYPMGALATRDGCQQYCFSKGAPFFALSNGTVCTCGARLPENAPSPDPSMCTVTCAGNSSEICGGPQGASVYRTVLTSGLCQPGFVMFGTNCYQYLGAMGGSDMQPWLAARTMCNNNGASLASIHSRAENQFISSLAFYYNGSNTRIIYVGGYLYRTDYSYQWTDGTPFDFANWRPNEPNNANTLGNELVLTIFTNYPTPYKGTWNDASGSAPFPYVCKYELDNSMDGYPEIYFSSVKGSLYCAPQSALGGMNIDLSVWYSFDSASLSNNLQITDLSNNNRNSALTPTNGGSPSSYRFTFVAGIVNKALQFTGAYYLKPTVQWDVRRNQITVATWVQQSNVTGVNVASQLLISKSYDVNATDTSVPSYEWALMTTAGGTTLCFIVGPFRACAPNPALGVWAHIGGVFDGNDLKLYINGQLASHFDLIAQLNMTFNLPHNPNTFVVVGFRSATPSVASLAFVGALDDLRVYQAALTWSQLTYLYRCTPSNAPTNVINLYIGSASTLVVGGVDFNGGRQSVSLSSTNCAAGNPVELGPVPVVPLGLTPIAATISIPSLSPPPPNPNSTVPYSSLYSACYVNMMDSDVVIGDTNFDIAVTAIQTVAGFGSSFTVNTSQLPMNVRLTGVNLRNGQVLAVALDSGCNMIESTATLYSASSTGQTAFVTLPRPVTVTDLMHLCWGASAAAISAANYADNLIDIGISVNLRSPLQYKRIARIDASTAVTLSAIQNGMYTSPTNYFLACSDAEVYGDNFMIAITMGLYTDYLLPLPGMSVCDVLTASPYQSTHSFTATNPMKSTFDGTLRLVPPSYQYGRLGGSPEGFPTDGRQFLSFWGDSLHPYNFGGCCSSRFNMPVEWYQTYSMLVYNIPNTSVFMSTNLFPTAVVPNAGLVIDVQLNDNHGVVLSAPTVFLVTIGTQNWTVTAPNGRLSLNFANISNNVTFTASLLTTMTLLVSVQAVAPVGYTITNQGSLAATLPVMDPLPAGVTAVVPGMALQTVLHFGPLNTTVPMPYLSTGLSWDYFAALGGEGSLRPVPGQQSTATPPRSSSSSTPVTAQWTEITSSNGQWLNTAAPLSVEFFSIGFYSPFPQTVRLVYACDDALKLYLDGASVLEHYSPTNGTLTDRLQLGAGWHQVIAKIANQYTLSLFSLGIYGTGLGWSTSVPAIFPDGTQPIVMNQPIMEALRLGPLGTYLIGTFSEDFLNTESDARPQPNDQAQGLVWADTVVASGIWQVDGNVINATEAGTDAYAVTYFAFAVCASVLTSNVWSIAATGPMMVWYDGQLVLFTMGTTRPIVEPFTVEAGCHQILVKAGAAAGTLQTVVVTPNSATAPMAWALALPPMLPSTANPISNGVPLTSFLALTNTMAPGAPHAAIPFDSTNTSQQTATFSDFPINMKTHPEPLDRVNISTQGQNWVYQWSPMSAAADGTLSDSYFGGDFNAYWSVAVYATVNISAISVQLQHNNGFSLWVDGALVTSANEYSTGGTSATISLTQGWHQVVLKLVAPSDFQFFTTNAGETLTWTQANSVCHQQRFRHLCSSQAYCPLGAARAGSFPLTGNASMFAPVRDMTNSWIQLGEGGNHTALCQTWAAAHDGAAPSWGMSPTAVPIRGVIGCCGGFVPPSVSIALTIASSEPSAALGWAYAFPPIYVARPFVQATNPRGQNRLVSMTCSTPDCVMYFTTDFSTPTRQSTLYTGPFNVTETTFFVVIAFVGSISQSQVTYYQAYVEPAIRFQRTTCVASAACLTAVFGADIGSMVTLVSARGVNATALSWFLSSQAYAASLPVGPSYPGLLPVSGNFTVFVPPMVAGQYYLITYDYTGVGTINSQIMTIAAVYVSPSQAVGTAATLLEFTGGLQQGDGILFLEPLYSTTGVPPCVPTSCARAMLTNPNALVIAESSATANGEFTTTVNLANFVGSIHCMCICATGGSTDFWSNAFSFNAEVASALPVSIEILQPRHSNESITSVGPAVVSDDEILTILGTFDGVANGALPLTLQYQTLFTPASGQSTNVPVPQCAITIVSTTNITCRMSVQESTSGVWLFSLYHQNSMVLNAPGLVPLITALPPPLSISGATGACAEHSDACVTGALLQFFGSGFDTVTQSNNVVQIGGSNSGIRCPIVNVTTTYLYCSLLLDDSSTHQTLVKESLRATPSGSYSVVLLLTVADGTTMTIDTGATLTFGAGANPGWSGAGAPTPAPAGTVPSPSHDDDKNETLVVVCATVGAVCFILIVIVVVVRMRYTFVPRTAKQSAEMDYIEEQLMAQVEQEQMGGGRRLPRPGNQGEDSLN